MGPHAREASAGEAYSAEKEALEPRNALVFQLLASLLALSVVCLFGEAVEESLTLPLVTILVFVAAAARTGVIASDFDDVPGGGDHRLAFGQLVGEASCLACHDGANLSPMEGPQHAGEPPLSPPGFEGLQGFGHLDAVMYEEISGGLHQALQQTPQGLGTGQA